MDDFHKNAFIKQLGGKISPKYRLIKNATCPQKLYKYRPLNDYTIDLFKNSSIYHANVDSFNDPNDGINNYLIEHTDDNIESLCRKLSKNKGQAFQDEIEFFQSNPDKFQELIQMMLNDDMKKYGISCFTKKHDNFLMWSHYAENHSGICIEFDFSSEVLDNKKSGDSVELKDYHFFYMRKVRYSKGVPKIKYEEISNEKFTPIYCKSSNWKYEEEYRSIRPKVGTYPFNKSYLKAVYFGTKTNIQKIQELLDLLKKLAYNETKFFKMKRQIGSYDLITEPIAMQ